MIRHIHNTQTLAMLTINKSKIYCIIPWWRISQNSHSVSTQYRNACNSLRIWRQRDCERLHHRKQELKTELTADYIIIRMRTHCTANSSWALWNAQRSLHQKLSFYACRCREVFIGFPFDLTNTKNLGEPWPCKICTLNQQSIQKTSL